MKIFSVFTDRNRQGVYYQMTNNDFFSRQPVWFPPGHNAECFDGYHSEMFNQPEDGRAPDEYIIRLAGVDKMGDSALVCITPGTLEWMLKYRQYKGAIFGDDLGKYE